MLFCLLLLNSSRFNIFLIYFPFTHARASLFILPAPHVSVVLVSMFPRCSAMRHIHNQRACPPN